MQKIENDWKIISRHCWGSLHTVWCRPLIARLQSTQNFHFRWCFHLNRKTVLRDQQMLCFYTLCQNVALTITKLCLYTHSPWTSMNVLEYEIIDHQFGNVLKLKGRRNKRNSRKSSTISFSRPFLNTLPIFSHMIHIFHLLKETNYMNHGDSSSNNEYYLPCFTM